MGGASSSLMLRTTMTLDLSFVVVTQRMRAGNEVSSHSRLDLPRVSRQDPNLRPHFYVPALTSLSHYITRIIGTSELEFAPLFCLRKVNEATQIHDLDTRKSSPG